MGLDLLSLVVQSLKDRSFFLAVSRNPLFSVLGRGDTQ